MRLGRASACPSTRACDRGGPLVPLFHALTYHASSYTNLVGSPRWHLTVMSGKACIDARASRVRRFMPLAGDPSGIPDAVPFSYSHFTWLPAQVRSPSFPAMRDSPSLCRIGMGSGSLTRQRRPGSVDRRSALRAGYGGFASFGPAFQSPLEKIWRSADRGAAGVLSNAGCPIAFRSVTAEENSQFRREGIENVLDRRNSSCLRQRHCGISDGKGQNCRPCPAGGVADHWWRCNRDLADRKSHTHP